MRWSRQMSGPGAQARERGERRWVAGGGALLAALALLLGLAFPYAEATRNANERPRLLQGIALVDEGAWAIDGVAARYGLSPGPDVARDPRSGRLYPNKPPATSVVAAAALVIARAVDDAPDLRGYTWWARLLGGLAPTLALVAFLWWRFAAFVGPRALAAGLSLYALATPAAAYAHLFYGHQLAAALLTIGSVMAIDGVRGRRAGVAFVGGALAACAVAVEYAAAFAGAPLATWMIARLVRGRGAGWPLGASVGAAVVGALAPIAGLAAYHARAFGGALSTGYHNVIDPGFAAKHGQGLLGLGAPSWASFEAQILGQGAGLVVWAPLVIVGAAGLAIGPRDAGARAATRAERGVFAATLALFVAIAASLSFTGGWRVGPRYLVAVMPAAALGIACLIGQARGRAGILGPLGAIAGASLVVHTLAAALWPHFDLDAVRQPIAEVLLPLWSRGREPYDLLRLFGGIEVPCVDALVFGAVVLGLGLLVRASGGRRAAAAVVIGGALGIVAVGATRSVPPHPRAARNLAYVERVWEPPIGGGEAASVSVARR